MLDAKHAQQVGVTPALFTHPFVRADHKDRGIRSGCTCDHVLQKFLMPRRVDNGVTAPRRSKRNLCGVDGDVLLLLFEQCIEQEGEFKRHPFSSAGFFHLLDFSFRE